MTNVFQNITNNASNYVLACKMLKSTQNILRTQCTKCLELMLEDICKLDWVNKIVEHAKSIT